MKRRIKILAVLCSCISLTSVLISGQEITDTYFNSISKAEVEMLLADVAKTNPKTLERLVKDPEARKQQIENLKLLLAYARQAQREGMADDPTYKQELRSIRAEVAAVNYDREINKDNPSMLPFGYVTDQQIAAYWADKKPDGAKGQRTREDEFNDFLKAKIEILRASDPEMKDREITPDEIKQARDVFARIRIYEAEYEQKVATAKLPRSFADKVDLQVKLQQAQFLSRMYAEKIAHKLMAAEEEITDYLAAHPEFDPSVKKAKAQSILERANAGEDFSTLANKFSEDPGNYGPDGKLQGGIYVDVPEGRMVPPFENAALALEPGQIAPQLVESDYGYHVIKLERKGVSKDASGKATQTYDVRHILISTGYKDPTDANAREIPVRDYVRKTLEEGKEKLLGERLVAENKISVPEDFTVPEITEDPPAKSTKKTRVVKKRPKKRR